MSPLITAVATVPANAPRMRDFMAAQTILIVTL
jgi:hypothetical protein